MPPSHATTLNNKHANGLADKTFDFCTISRKRVNLDVTSVCIFKKKDYKIIGSFKK